jgi:CDP-diacylglycerol--glycerol-3-phosphate 3-phosphatidyltransferase
MNMSWLYTFKPQKDRALYSVSRILQTAGLTPNMVTAAGLLMSMIAGLLAASGHLYAGIFFFMIGACLDAADGSFARACGLCTGFGRYFDSICDRLSELIFIVGVVIGGVSYSAFAVIAGSLLLMATRIYNHRKGLDSNAAMFGRPERLALLIAGLLAPAPYNMALFLAAGFLCLVSSGQILAAGTRRDNRLLYDGSRTNAMTIQASAESIFIIGNGVRVDVSKTENTSGRN